MTPTISDLPFGSLWLCGPKEHTFAPLDASQETDVVIVGGGITGLLCARALQRKGQRVIVLEKDTLYYQTTGNTTAKATVLQGILARPIVSHFGLEKASRYFQSQQQALEDLKEMLRDYGLDRPWMHTFNMVYADTAQAYQEIVEEHRLFQEMGLPSQLTVDMPYALPGLGGIQVPDQLALDPIELLERVVKDLVGAGAALYEHTMAEDVEETADSLTVKIKGGHRIDCQYVISASGFPFYDGDANFFARLEPLRSYLAAFPIEKMGEGMLISHAERPWSVRFAQKEDQAYLLVGGRGHKVGQEKSAKAIYEEIEQFAGQHFSAGAAVYRWSAQDYQAPDSLPYIGRLSKKHPRVLVATGFRKWGMTLSVTAATVLSDLIINGHSPLEDLLDPGRGGYLKNLPKLSAQNLNVAAALLKGKAAQPEKEAEQLEKNEGALVRYRGQKVGGYRDSAGTLHLVKPVCTHMGCDLFFNDAEHSFDCPCHGSRFSYTGKLIEGAAMRDLETIDPQDA